MAVENTSRVVDHLPAKVAGDPGAWGVLALEVLPDLLGQIVRPNATSPASERQQAPTWVATRMGGGESTVRLRQRWVNGESPLRCISIGSSGRRNPGIGAAKTPQGQRGRQILGVCGVERGGRGGGQVCVV